MKEVNSGGIQPETQQPKSNVIDFEAARQKRQAEQKSQIRRSVMSPPTQADSEERHTARRQQRIREELGNTENQPKDGQERQKSFWTPEDDERLNEMFGGQSEEQIEARNEQIKARREKEQAEKEKVREEALKQYKKYQEMPPEEREAQKKWLEEKRKEFEYALSPEGKREFAALMVRGMKSLGILPPNVDYLWLNLPSGWAEYREMAGVGANKEPSYTVTFGTEPTQEQWNEYYPDLQAKMRAWKAEKVRKSLC
jgi:hypothetical protein